MGYKKGTITVFLSLIFLIIVSLVCTVIESARVNSSIARASQVTYISLDSIFSCYAKEVFEEYGIAVLWKNSDEIKNDFEYFVENNINSNYYLETKDFYGLKFQDMSVENVQYITDEDGEIMAGQIIDYMKYALSEDIINEIINKSNSLSENEDISEFYEEMEGCNDTLSEMENSVLAVYENTKTISDYPESPKEILENMKTYLEEIIYTVGDDDYSNEVRNNYFDMYKIYYRKYIDWQNTVNDSFNNIFSSTDEYIFKIQDVAMYLEGMEDSLLEMVEGGISTEISSALSEEVDVLKNEMDSSDKDIYNVFTNELVSKNQFEIVKGIIDSFSSVYDENKEMEYSGNKLSNYDNYEKFIDETYQSVCEAYVYAEKYDVSNMTVKYEYATGKGKKNEIIEFVNEIRKNGVLGYISAGEISDKKIDKNNLPSVTSTLNKAKNWKYPSYTKSVAAKAIIGQYVFDKFSCYTDKVKGENLEYEVEYILEGKNNDRDNLSIIVDELVTIRTGFNLIYLAKDTQKRNEAYELALSIVGYSGMPVLVSITQFLIIGAWAYAESVVDVRDLLNGYNVKLIKNEDEWNLSLSGLMNLESTDKDKENRSGLSYKDYLRVFLFKENQSDQVYRIEDLIELNVRKKYNDTFKMNECITRINVSSTYMMDRFFSILGNNKKDISDKRNSFSFEITQAYGY